MLNVYFVRKKFSMNNIIPSVVFATNNVHKLREISVFLEGKFNILSLKDIGCSEELPETQLTLEGNARQKVFYVFEKYLVNYSPKISGVHEIVPLCCFADDTGLEIAVLDGLPGVYSARYAGPQCSPDDNIRKVLSGMKGISDRKAVFRTVISLVVDGQERVFEGCVNGVIPDKRVGAGGFGYDPIFKPVGFDISFAQMSLSQKNTISHRAKAVEKLKNFLIGHYLQDISQSHR